MDLHDRVALITGASGGLGAAIARMLADCGAHVAVTHLGHREEASDLCGQIQATGRKTFLVHLDQTDRSIRLGYRSDAGHRFGRGPSLM